uniref:Uncharacterized protein n=1 Tax=Vespula pensylvanica TaxID=30213 RepID=A0A834NS51_VESPE|nr:hypothetical protein H0235_011492 [Vespula pensylvanica]
MTAVDSNLSSGVCRESTTGRAQVVIEVSDVVVVVVKSKVTVSPWVSKCSNLPAVRPGSEVLVICLNFVGCKYSRANGCVLQDLSKILSH